MTNSGNSGVDETPEDDQPSVPSPFATPAESQSPLPNTSRDPSVFAEPWMQAVLHPEDPGDPGPALPLTDQVSEDQSVWDEPGLSAELAGATPTDGLTWYRWYEQQVERTTESRTWLVTLAVALAGGVFAILGTIVGQTTAGSMLLAVVVFGPTMEEVMKIGLVLWLVEKKPWLYRHGGQILFCALVSGLVFAAVENVLYLRIYIDDPPPGLALWRWTICVLLHAGCSTVAGLGAWRIWQRFRQQRRAPVLSDGAPFIVTAIVLHGLYNGTVTLLELSGLEF